MTTISRCNCRAESSNRYPRAFTLIELLVVVAIVALLIAILLPSLARAREMSKAVTCTSNLRQLCVGWHLYADENRDISVPGRFGEFPGGRTNRANWYNVGNGMKFRPRWIAAMGRYIGQFGFSRPSTTDDRQDYEGAVYQCSAVPERVDERNHAYGYNHQFLGNARMTGGRFHNFPVNRTRITHFDRTVLGADCLGTAAGLPRVGRLDYDNQGRKYAQLGNHGWTLDPPRLGENSERGSGDADSPRTGVDPRHLRKATVVFCDGHAESRTPEQLGYRILPDGKFVDQETMENPPTNDWFSGTTRDDLPPKPPAR